MQRARHSCLSFTFLAFFAVSLLPSAPAQASEYGFGVYGLGYGIPMSGYTPPPGVYFSDTFYLYSGR
ncbi:MAG: transporter, partial [Methylocella sp.]